MTTKCTCDFDRLMYLLDTNNFDDARTMLKQETIERNSLLDKLDEQDNTLLHRYVLRDQPDAVHLLLEHGASVCAMNKHGWLPIHLAAYCGQSRTIIQYLLEFERR